MRNQIGPYGINIVSKLRYYKEYKNKSKCIKFIDKYSDLLKEVFYKKAII